jgi:hypothetical protein
MGQRIAQQFLLDFARSLKPLKYKRNALAWYQLTFTDNARTCCGAQFARVEK